MRLPRVCSTVRRLMLMVAIAAFSVWSLKMLQLSRDHARNAQSCKNAERIYRQAAASAVKSAEFYEQTAGHVPSDVADWDLPKDLKDWIGNSAQRYKHEAANSRDDVARRTILANHYGALARKYDRATRYPWLPVEPDPQSP